MVERYEINKSLVGQVTLSKIGVVLIQLRFNKEATFHFPLLWISKPLQNVAKCELRVLLSKKRFKDFSIRSFYVMFWFRLAPSRKHTCIHFKFHKLN